ncbi:MAG: hypothetical protein MJ141_02775 [Clostridia bacterium]|nr:hypothetical protein [Clostridia bacterium]
MKNNYYDPMFYICTEEMPFTIRIETNVKESVDPKALFDAAEEALVRYPYFKITVIRDGEELIARPNPKPIAVYPGPDVYALGSEQVNGHLFAISYEEKRICFYISHVITDGGGFFPFLKTLLYLYFCRRSGKALDPAGIRLPSEPFYPDELGNPFPEEAMKKAFPIGKAKSGPFFRLRDGGYVKDHERTVYRFRLDEAAVMRVNKTSDGSPSSLFSSLMARAVWKLHPENHLDIVSAVSFNLRPGLGNKNSYRMLSSAILLRYPEKLKDADVTRLCTCSRGMVTVQSQPENVLYLAEQKKNWLESMENLTLSEKKAMVGKAALADAVGNTFSVSYVGKVGLGSLEEHIESMYNLTDGSTYETVFIEVASVGGQFDIAFLQGFSSDVYYRAFLEELRALGLAVTEDTCGPMGTAEMVLPE